MLVAQVTKAGFLVAGVIVRSGMVYVAMFSFVIALGVLFLMRDELTTGYFRWQDHLVTTPLLYGVAALVFVSDALLPTGAGLWFYILFLLRAFLACLLFVVVWGGTLTAGAMIVRGIGKQ